jgi:hypothetical protein
MLKHIEHFVHAHEKVQAYWFQGGVDYLLLTLVKLGWMDAELEKKFYVIISVWIRGPG